MYIYDRKLSGSQSRSYISEGGGLEHFAKARLQQSNLLGEILLADRSERIDRFLRREKGFQQWLILALLKCKALELTRGSVKSVITNESDKIKDGDQIELDSNLCNNTLQNLPETEYRDYAFANPKPADDYENGVSAYLRLRPQTTLLSDRWTNPSGIKTSVDSLADFIGALKMDERLDHPIRHLVVASHASRTGLLKLPLKTGSPSKVIKFEDLETAVTDTQIKIVPQLLEPRPKNGSGQIIAAQLHIKGCNIGNPIAIPFLRLLKKTLGGNVGITAPKFFHSLKMVDAIKFRRGGAVVSKKRVEIWEFFSYEFTLFRTTSLKRRVDAVAAFCEAAKVDPRLKRIDGSKIPQTDLERWIPKTLPGENRSVSHEVPVISTLSSNSHTAGAELRYRKTYFLEKEWQTVPFATDPGTDAKRIEEIKKKLVSNNDVFKGSHPFPMFARTGFKSIDDYFDSYGWRFKTFDTRKKELTFSGTRHEYTVLAPIVDTATNELFMNLFPVSGSPTIRIAEDNADFFTSL